MARISDRIDRRTFIVGATAVGTVCLIASQSQAQSSVLPRKECTLVETGSAELQSLRDAIAILKAKDSGGPALDGWTALSNPHKDNCFTGDQREIHFSWWFLPWHRAYIHAVERRLQQVISEPKLRLPYWDWFSVDQVPDAFIKPTYMKANGQEVPNPLVDETRAKNSADRAPQFTGMDGERITRRVRGNYASERDLLRSANFVDVGGGSPTEDNDSGAIETGPHGSIHVWVGGVHSVIPGRRGGNMGQEYSPLDPVFILHHGNIDRLWSVWRSLTTGGPHNNPSDPAWLNKTFPMPHHTGVGTETYRIGDLLETAPLGYSYDREMVEVASSRGAGIGEGGQGADAVSIVMNSTPLDLSGGDAKTETRSIPRTRSATAPTDRRGQVGKLLLSGVRLPLDTVTFSIYLTSPETTENTDDNLVAVQTVLNPTGRPLAGEKGIRMVVQLPENVQARITQQQNISFNIVIGDGRGNVPLTPAAREKLRGVSIAEVKLIFE